ncbi:dimethyl sulfoxide reductase, subunit A1 [Salmonella enterica subsp. enterica]|uniref:Dimethyl sulfoxide reductase, subunit A1 n=1 Tax=Salmonella enterica I TaxID=59201 RepID=A0A379WW08_SALET|nr:dimethyl sulfoxide reductase, subunit A1 [Salmonella enterica subsp. enterica]
MQARDPALPAYDELKKMGIYKRKDPNGHFVAYKKFREDPQANPLKTPSGKIEIYSSKLAHIASTWELAEGDVISPLPIIPLLLKDGTIRNGAPSRYSCLAFTINPVPIQATAILMFCRPPVARRCG